MYLSKQKKIIMIIKKNKKKRKTYTNMHFQMIFLGLLFALVIIAKIVHHVILLMFLKCFHNTSMSLLRFILHVSLVKCQHFYAVISNVPHDYCITCPEMGFIREVQTCWNGAHFDSEVSVASDAHMHKLCNLYLNANRYPHFSGLAVKLNIGRIYIQDALK